MMKTILIYLPKSMADHELGFLLQGLSMQKMMPGIKYGIKFAGVSKEPVKTIAGMTVLPDHALSEIIDDDVAALILPGAETWHDDEQKEVLHLAEHMLNKGVILAAICGAVLGLADTGLLDNRKHTANALDFLTGMSKNYNGKQYYVNELAVKDGNLVTASSAGSLLWARYILEGLNIFSPKATEAWYNCFLTGDAEYYSEMLRSFSEREEA